MADRPCDGAGEGEGDFVPSRLDRFIAKLLVSPLVVLFGLLVTLVIAPVVVVRCLIRGEFRDGARLLLLRIVPVIVVVIGVYAGLRAMGFLI